MAVANPPPSHAARAHTRDLRAFMSLQDPAIEVHYFPRTQSGALFRRHNARISLHTACDILRAYEQHIYFTYYNGEILSIQFAGDENAMTDASYELVP